MPVLAIHHLHTIVPTRKGGLDVRDLVLGVADDVPFLESMLEASRQYA